MSKISTSTNSTDYKVSFEKISKLSRLSDGTLPTASLTISLTNHLATTGNKLLAIIEKCNKSFSQCDVMLCDTLHRFNLMMDNAALDENQAYLNAKALGVEWAHSNQFALHASQIPCNIIYWDTWLNHKLFQEKKSLIDGRFMSDLSFKEAIYRTAGSYLSRKHNNNTLLTRNMELCIEYLKEECAVMLLWAECSYNFELYPAKRNEAMEKTHQIFIEKQHNHQVLNPIKINIKYKTNKTAQFAMAAWNSLLKVTDGHVYVKDTNGCYVFCNDKQTESLGLHPTDIIGKSDYDFSESDKADQYRLNDEMIMKSGKLTVIEEPAHYNGKTCTFLSTKAPIYDQQNKIIGLIGISIDITARKDAERLKAELDFVDILLRLSPGHVYWKDLEGKILGCNDLQAIDAGFKSSSDIVGMTDYDMPWKEDADDLRAADATVIKSGKPLVIEEKSETADGRKAIWLSRKEPLRNNHGEIIGIIGVSIDITAQKEKEAAAAAEQERFREIVNHVMHDITSPLMTINTIANKLGSAIPEADRVNLRGAAARISGIAGNLLNKYTKADLATQDTAIVASLALLQTINEKEEEYKDTNIAFKVNILAATHFSCIKINPDMFKRMLSNLVNNAVDALQGQANAKIRVCFTTTPTMVVIILEDNGPGMPQIVQDKFAAGIAVTEGKGDKGHGIGLTQVRETIKNSGGNIEIQCPKDGGTSIIMKFPQIESPTWLASEIMVGINDIVVILDDDEFIHGSWDKSFAEILQKYPTIQIQHFTEGVKAVAYINNLTAAQKHNLFLLTDYELLDQNLNGLDVVAQVGIKNAALVTSYAAHKDKQQQVMQAGIKMLPKELADVVPIKVDKKIPQWSKKVDLLWLEDQKYLVDNLINTYYSHLNVAVYYDPISFMDDIHQFPLDTRIILDMYYEMPDGTLYDTDAVVLSRKLGALGYMNIIIYTSVVPDIATPEHIKVILKTDLTAISQLDKV